VGDKSESEQIPKNPDHTDKILQVGAANTAIVRIWRECGHKYPVASTLTMGAELESSDLVKYPSGSELCEVPPSFERVPPVATKAANQFCADEFSPFHGVLTSAADSVCAGRRSTLFNYFNTDSAASRSGRTKYPASTSAADNAFFAANDDNKRTAGVLFGSCKNPQGTSNKPSNQTAYCLNPANGSNPIGRAKPGSVNIDDNKTFESQCNDGPMAGESWNWYDYAAQLSQKMTSPSGAGKSGLSLGYSARASDGVRKKSADNFIELFQFWNPPLREQLKRYRSLGLFKDTDKLRALVDRFGEGTTFPKGKWLPAGPLNAMRDAVKASKSNVWDERTSKDVACNVFTDWMAADWKLGGSEEGVSVNLQPIPNRLYLIQVVMLDQRENIISQSLQFAGGFAKGQLPAVDPEITSITEDPICLKWSARQRGGTPTAADYITYKATDGYPTACEGVTPEIIEVGPSPAASTFSSSQPRSQISGQNWPLRDSAGAISLFGGFQAAADGSSSSTLPEGTPALGEKVFENKEMAKLWQPRALAVSIFNPDNYKKRASSSYLQSHRIETLSDKGSEIDTMDRFALKGELLTIPKPGDSGWIGNPSKTGDIASDWEAADQWFQAKLPLLSANSNLFYNYWSVSSSNPTRAPEELNVAQTGIRQDAVFAARNPGNPSPADPGSAQKAAWADEASRSKVDETRFGSLLGEGRFIWKNSIAQSCTSPADPESEPDDCVPVPPTIEAKWRKLTSDNCDDTGEPKISINNDQPRTCNADAAVGAGWKVKDAYDLPALPAAGGMSPQVELASVFKTSETAPAHLQLEGIPKENLRGVAVWSLADYLGRDSSSTPSYSTAAGVNSINFCVPREPRFYKGKAYQGQYSAQFSRRINHYKNGQFTTESLLQHGTSPSTEKQSFPIDPGSSVDQTDGRWWTFTPSSPGEPRYNYMISTSDQTGGAEGARSRVRDLMASGGAGYAGGRAPWSFAGGWGVYGANAARNWATDSPVQWLRNKAGADGLGNWGGYQTDSRNWSGTPGNSWWFGPEDQGGVNLYKKVWEADRYTEYDAVEYFPYCGDMPQYDPNAIIKGSTPPALAPKLPAGDWVVVFTVQGPLGVGSTLSSTRWGIKGHYSQSKDIQWVNNFNLQQTSDRTAIYRYRPTG
jgi:hypothetical protein